MSDPEEPGPRARSLRPTSGRALAVCGVLGLLTGWSAHPLGERVTGQAPMLSWAQPVALLVAAAVLAFLAAHTWRTVQVLGRRLEVHHAVNRLVLARAGALAGALFAGGYAGFAVSWLDDDSAPAQDWLTRSVVAALGALIVMVASLVLERACRTPVDEDRP